MPEQFTTPIGRLVGGHPMKRNSVTRQNPQTKAMEQVMQADGVTPASEAYIGVAIPKNPGVDWKQEPWGQLIVKAGNEGFPNGQSNMPTFAWKVTDGDSAIPNQNNIAPNTREGYPGHWVLNMATRFVIKCYHVGKYDPMDQIQNENEIKPGDYCRVALDVKGNDSTQSPGVYLNPSLFELSRPGELIVLSSGPSAADAFGGGQPPVGQPPVGQPPVGQPPVGQPPVGQPPVGQPPVGQPPAPPVQPAPDFLDGPKKYLVNGQVYSHEQLVGFGWSEQQIATATPYTGQDVPF